jgi:hypothetical protein
MGKSLEASDAYTDSHTSTSRLRVGLSGQIVPFSLLLAFVLSVLGGVAETTEYRREVLAIAVGIAVAVCVALRPKLYVFALGATLFVPYSWSPTLINAPTPAIILIALPAGIAAMIALARRGNLRPCVLDWLVLAVFISAVLSEIAVGVGAGILGSHTLSHNEAEVLILPYLTFRVILAAWPNMIESLPAVFMTVGAGLAVMAIVEAATHTNLFAHSSLNNPELVVWEHTFPRAGGIRADATMGHPIALGSFLIIPLVFAFSRRRWGIFLLLALGEALTLSRGPYVAALVALLLCSILTRQMGRFLGVVLVVAAAGVFIGPVRNSVLNSFNSGTKEAKTATYRSELLGTSLSALSLWGKPTGRTDELFASRGEVNLPDVTSEFALMTGRQGVLGISTWIAFLAAFVYVMREALKRRDRLLLFAGVALTAEWVALLSVALITSFQYAFWLTVAMVAVRISQRPAKQISVAATAAMRSRPAPREAAGQAW